MADEVGGAGELGREGKQANVAAGGLLEPVEELDGGRLEQVARVDAAFGVGEERAFEVDAERGGLVRGRGALDGVREAFEGAEGVVDGGGDGGGEVVSGAAGGEEALDCAQFRGRGVHDVVAGGAVNVDVEEGGREDRFGADGWVGGDVGDQAGGVDGDRGVGDGADGGDEGAGGECGHGGVRVRASLL